MTGQTMRFSLLTNQSTTTTKERTLQIGRESPFEPPNRHETSSNSCRPLLICLLLFPQAVQKERPDATYAITSSPISFPLYEFVARHVTCPVDIAAALIMQYRINF